MKSLPFVRRNGKFSEFDLKKTLLRCLRAIFGVLFSILTGKNPPLFLTKGVFSCPFLVCENGISTDSRHFYESDGRQHCKNEIIGIRGLKRRRNKAKQWYFPHDMDKTPERQTFLWKIQPLYCIFPPRQRGMWINYRLKSGILSSIAWFCRCVCGFFHISPLFCGKHPTFHAMRLATRGIVRIFSAHCIHDEHQNHPYNVVSEIWAHTVAHQLIVHEKCTLIAAAPPFHILPFRSTTSPA